MQFLLLLSVYLASCNHRVLDKNQGIVYRPTGLPRPANLCDFIMAKVVFCLALVLVCQATSGSSSNSSSSSSSNFFDFSVLYRNGSCTRDNLPDKLIEVIQNEINNKGKLVIDIYENIARLGKSLKNKEDYYEALANKTLDDAILPINQLVQIIGFIGDRNLTEEALDALVLIAKTKKEVFKTQRNYGCYAEKLYKLYLDMNATINNYIRNISVQNIYNKCIGRSPPSCGYYAQFFECVISELYDFSIFIKTLYNNATELNDTTNYKDEIYKQRVEDWFKQDATIQINIIIQTFTDWILKVLQENEQAKRRCDEVALTQIKNVYNDQLPRLTAAGNCIANTSNQQKSFKYCQDLYFCGKLEDALSVFINSPITDSNILEIFKSMAKNYYETALESLKTFIKSFIKNVEIFVQEVQNETNAFDNVRNQLSNLYSISNACNATNIPAKSYCVCAANFASEKIKLLTNIVVNTTQQCANQGSILSQRKSEVLQFVTSLVQDLKAKAQAEAEGVVKLNNFMHS